MPKLPATNQECYYFVFLSRSQLFCVIWFLTFFWQERELREKEERYNKLEEEEKKVKEEQERIQHEVTITGKKNC